MQDQGTEIERLKVLRPTTNSKYTAYEIFLLFFSEKTFFFCTLYF